MLAKSKKEFSMYRIKMTHKLPLSMEECWKFFSTPQNLKVITPPGLNFKMLFEDTEEEMYPGQIIGHIVHPIMNIPIKWLTQITHIEKGRYFIDEQRLGPYKLWIHEHRFEPIPHGVEMSDTIYYKMPYGILGRLLNALKVKNDLENIFSFRKSKLQELFGTYTAMDHKL
jgi:ligand-binding SRPBCC domain-containing protein